MLSTNGMDFVLSWSASLAVGRSYHVGATVDFG